MSKAFGYLPKQAFRALWRAAGKPQAKLIGPVSGWTLPSGVTYNAHFDQFVDESKAKVSVSWATQPGTTIPIVPDKASHAIVLAIPGVTTTSTTPVITLWAGDVETAIKTCWGVSMGSRLYRVSSWTPVPEGVPEPSTILLQLQEVTNAGT